MELINLRIAFHTLGCKVNSYETEVMTELVKNEGAIIVPFQEPADFYIVNTCSVTNMADRKSRQMLHRAKKENPEAVIVAAGCYAQVSNEAVLKETGVDLIIDNDKKGKIVSVLSEYMKEHREASISDISLVKDFDSMELTEATEHTRAYIKVQDGCNQFCSYCIIPYARGRIRSKEKEDVKSEIEALVRSGVQEFVLTGIHLSSYGKEKKEEDGLLHLIQMVSEISGVKRIRLGSLEPRIVTEEFAKALSNIPNLCPHFHLSLQSGSEKTLKAMNRHYTPEEYKKGCAILRKYFDDPAITTDVIVGFPGETEEDFEDSYQFVKEIGFYEMHIFKYSRRKGTVADRMPNQVPEEKKTARSEKMIALSDEMSDAYRLRHIGKTAEVLTEEPIEIDGKTYFTGYTKEYIRVAVAGDVKDNVILKGSLKEKLKDEIYLFSE